MTEAARVVVTRSVADATHMTQRLEEEGLVTIHLPVIDIAPSGPTPDIDAAIERLAGGVYEWVVFASVNGFETFGRILEARDAVIPKATNVAAVGPATASALARHDVRADLVPDVHTGAELAAALGDGTGRVLLPRPADAPRAVLEALEKRGWIPEEVVTYRTIAGSPDSTAVERVRNGGFDVLTFTSGSTARFFVELVSAPTSIDWTDKHVVSIGPSTAAVARALGFPIYRVAQPHTIDGLVRAVLDVVGR